MEIIRKTNYSPDHGQYLTQWHGYTLAKQHSLAAKLKDIIEDQIGNEVTTLSIRGREGTGKTTLAMCIAHELHERLAKLSYDPEVHGEYERKHIERIREGYIVRLLTAKDLMNFTRTLMETPDSNRIFIFDDTSFLDKLKEVKREVTLIRHPMKDGKHTNDKRSLKSILIYNFHSGKALNPYLRDTQYIFQTGISAEEMENTKDIMGGNRNNNARMVDKFKFLYLKFRKQRHITMNLTNGKKNPVFVKYKYSAPFRLAMYFDGNTTSYVAYPGTEELGVDKCHICQYKRTAEKIRPDGLLAWLKEQYIKPDSPSAVNTAMRQLAFSTIGRDPGEHTPSHVLGLIRLLARNGAIDVNDLLEAHYGTEAMEAVTRTAYVRKEEREAFKAKFGIDALYARHDRSHPIPDEAADDQDPEEPLEEGEGDDA